MAHVIPNTNQEIDDAIANGLVAMIDGVSFVTAGQKSGTTLGTNATAEGKNTTASGGYSHAEGYLTVASAANTHAEGYKTEASGLYAHAEGYQGLASGSEAHAEGNTTYATGVTSHAEGSGTTASGMVSHAEGISTTADGYGAHAEGGFSRASGYYAHAEGRYTIANHMSQSVCGQFNEADPSAASESALGNYVEIVGNGTADNARSNARTLDWSGNEVLAGKLTMGADPTGDMDAVPKKWLDSAFITESVSGDLASFADGADDVPVKDLLVTIDPVQDLRGYDNPWPAGANKNLIPYPYYNNDGTYAGIPITTDADGRIKGSGTSSAAFYFNLTGTDFALPAGTYTISVKGNHTGPTIRLRNTATSTNVATISNGAADGSTTFTLESDEAALRIDLARTTGGQTFNLDCTIQLESGNEPTSYVPFSNVCPITGWTGANVYRTGANVWDEQWEVGAYNTSTGAKVDTATSQIRSKYARPIPVKPSTEYCFYCVGARISQLFWYDKDDNFISNTPNSSSNPFITTSPANAAYLRFQFPMAYGTTYQNDAIVNVSDASINGHYYAYVGTAYPVSWTSEGTVYKGTLNVTTGVLTANAAMYVVTGAESEWTDYSPYVQLNKNVLTGRITGTSITGICSMVKTENTGRLSNTMIQCNSSTGNYLRCNGVLGGSTTWGQAFANLAAWKAWLASMYSANTPLQVMFELATPVTYQLTPTQIETLLGVNNIWADCGDVSVDYRADTKLYIDSRA